MKRCLCFLLLWMLAASGCTTGSRRTAETQASFAQQQALAQMQQAQQPTVFIRGEVRNPTILWNEDHTLSRAIVAAEYRGPWAPHLILILRKGQTFKVNPKHLLWQTDDPFLEAGDIVEIQR